MVVVGMVKQRFVLVLESDSLLIFTAFVAIEVVQDILGHCVIVQ